MLGGGWVEPSSLEHRSVEIGDVQIEVTVDDGVDRSGGSLSDKRKTLHVTLAEVT